MIVEIEDPEIEEEFNLITKNMESKLADEDFVWECDCGSQLFFITPEGTQCASCMKVTTEWYDEI